MFDVALNSVLVVLGRLILNDHARARRRTCDLCAHGSNESFHIDGELGQLGYGAMGVVGGLGHGAGRFCQATYLSGDFARALACLS